MFRSPFVIILLVLSLFSTTLQALEVTDLYESNVIVDSQTLKARELAIKTALQNVLLKVGGKKSVLTHNILKNAQKKASRYVSQYRYTKINEQLSLVVSFNEDKINQLFEQANLALWGSLRPQVLLWLVDEQGASRKIVAFDDASMTPQTVTDFSMQRGLPIVLPLMDLTDSNHVFVSDFWAYFPEQIQLASQRYFADTVIVMRISDSSLVSLLGSDDELADVDSSNESDEQNATALVTGNCVTDCDADTTPVLKVLDWRVYTQGALYIQKYQGFDKQALINEALSDITELIYQSYALLTSTEEDFVIEVKNVTSLTNDAKLFDFLTQLSAVKNVVLTKAQGDVRQFKLDLNGSKTSFLASLKLNNKLTQILEPQFTDFLQAENDIIHGEQNTTLVGGLHQGVKVIILGEEPQTQEAPIPSTTPTNNSSAINEVNTSDNVIGDGIGDDISNVIGDNNGTVANTDNNNVGAETITDEQTTLLPDAIKPKPPIVIPVFYWDGI